MLLEVLDKTGKCLGIIEEDIVHDQKLLHKRAVLLSYNRDKELCLCKYRRHREDGIWDFPVNVHVPFRTSYEDIVTHHLKNNLGIFCPVKILMDGCYFKEKEEFITIFILKNMCGKIFFSNPEIEDVIFLQRVDFLFFFKRYPQVFSEYVNFLVKLGILYFGLNNA